MNIKYTALTTIIVFLIAAPSVWACDQARHEKRMQHLVDTLQLSDEQLENIRVIFNEHREIIKQNQEKLRNSRSQLREKIKGVLTEDQEQLFDAMPRPGRQRRDA